MGNFCNFFCVYYTSLKVILCTLYSKDYYYLSLSKGPETMRHSGDSSYGRP